SRFGVVVSERFAASAVPVLGAVGGATVNFVFMNHFQRVAHGHFTIRRLERMYGPATVRRHYEALVAQHADVETRPYDRGA
ncbi:MAG: EcsC family protein, partial [Rhodoplanes sp.]